LIEFEKLLKILRNIDEKFYIFQIKQKKIFLGLILRKKFFYSLEKKFEKNFEIFEKIKLKIIKEKQKYQLILY